MHLRTLWEVDQVTIPYRISKEYIVVFSKIKFYVFWNKSRRNKHFDRHPQTTANPSILVEFYDFGVLGCGNRAFTRNVTVQSISHALYMCFSRQDHFPSNPIIFNVIVVGAHELCEFTVWVGKCKFREKRDENTTNFASFLLSFGRRPHGMLLSTLKHLKCIILVKYAKT